MEIKELDYAILKSVYYGLKNTREIAKALKIRPIIVEKHIYTLIREGSLKYVQEAILTEKGNEAISEFEKIKSVSVWKPIDDFILSAIKNKKKQRLKRIKLIDVSLLIFMVILIILIIYYGIFY